MTAGCCASRHPCSSTSRTSSPNPRWQCRLWLQFCNTEYVPAFYKIILNKDEAQKPQLREKVLELLRELSRGIDELSNGGPYFMGSQFTLLDLSFGPFIERHPAVEDRGDCPIPDEPAFAPLHRWWNAVQARPSFQQTSERDADFWVWLYDEYAHDRYGRTYFKANPGGD